MQDRPSVSPSDETLAHWMETVRADDRLTAAMTTAVLVTLTPEARPTRDRATTGLVTDGPAFERRGTLGRGGMGLVYLAEQRAAVDGYARSLPAGQAGSQRRVQDTLGECRFRFREAIEIDVAAVLRGFRRTLAATPYDRRVAGVFVETAP